MLLSLYKHSTNKPFTTCNSTLDLQISKRSYAFISIQLAIIITGVTRFFHINCRPVRFAAFIKANI